MSTQKSSPHISKYKKIKTNPLEIELQHAAPRSQLEQDKNDSTKEDREPFNFFHGNQLLFREGELLAGNVL